MAISFDQALGIHESALKFRARRAEVLANNLANADTPGFKARDLDFKTALNVAGAGGLTMARTAAGHLGDSGSGISDDALAFRVPNQPSIDGNTVEDQVEHAEFMKNALAFQTSFMMLNRKFKGLSSAIRGD